MSFPMNNASGFSLTPFGMGTGTVNGSGSVSIGPMGVATSLAGPLQITPANTVNNLGVASPFAQPFGRFNPIQPNSFGQVNPFNPNQVTPYDAYNGAPFGSFGPNQNPLAPTSFMQGGSFSNSLLNPVSMGQNLGTANPLGFGGFNGTTQGFPQQQQQLGFPQQQPFGLPQQQPSFGAPFGFAQQGFAQQQQQNIAPPPVQIPPPNTSNLMSFLATGGGSFLMNQLSGGQQQQTIPTPASFGQQQFIQQQQQLGFPQPQQQLGLPQQQQAISGLGVQQLSPIFGQTPNFGPVNPFQQQMQNMQAQGGAGGKLVSPFGTFITSIGPQGGNANAGFLGAQAAGQASALVLNPLNPGMIVNYANPAYSSFNFNQGFFAS